MSIARNEIPGLCSFRLGLTAWYGEDHVHHRGAPASSVSLVVCEPRRVAGEVEPYVLLVDRGGKYGLPIVSRQPGQSDSALLCEVAEQLGAVDVHERHFHRHPEQCSLVSLTSQGFDSDFGHWFKLRDLPPNLIEHHRFALEEVERTFH